MMESGLLSAQTHTLIAILLALVSALFVGLLSGGLGILLSFWPPAPRLAVALQILTVLIGVLCAIISVFALLMLGHSNRVIAFLAFGLTLALLGAMHWPIVYVLNKRRQSGSETVEPPLESPTPLL